MNVKVSSRERQVSIVVVDDRPVSLHGLKTMVTDDPTLALVGTATDCEGAVRTAVAQRPDVVLMSLRFRDGDGINAVRRILAEHPATRVVVMSADDGPVALEALRAGALGFVSGDATIDVLRDAVHRAAAGEAVLPSSLLRAMAIQRREEEDPLSSREHEIIKLVADGKTNDQIAQTLGTSMSTVKGQLTTLFDKLGARDRASAVAICLRRGWLS